MWSLLLIGLLPAAAVEVEVRPLSGPAVSGTLAELSAEKLVLRSDEGLQTFDVQDLLAVSRRGADQPDAARSPIRVELVDGSVLLATDYDVEQGQATLELSTGRVEVPTGSIRSVRLKSATNEGLNRNWQQLAQGQAMGDLIVFRKAANELDHLEGAIHDIGPETVQFEFDGDRVPVRRERLEGVVYFHAARRALAEPVCRLTDRSGSQWNLTSLRLEDEQLELATAAGVELRLPLDQFGKLDYSTGNVTFLSNLQPQTVEWTPYFDAPEALPRLSSLLQPKLARLFQPSVDRSFDGGPLLLGDRSYERGLVIHSRTRLVYRLPAGFRHLRAVAGMDDRVGSGGNVRLEISGDGKPLFSQAITGRDEPLELDLDVRGVGRLSILVDYGEALDIADHTRADYLNLCDLRITK